MITSSVRDKGFSHHSCGPTATPIKERLLEEVQPVLLRAPEVTLGHPWSAPIDIWSVGCLVSLIVHSRVR